MSEFKFEHELNPSTRAAAALENEGQRILDEIEQDRHSFRAELRRLLPRYAIGITWWTAGVLYGSFQHIQLLWLLAYTLLVVVLFKAVIGRASVAQLIALGLSERRAIKQLADWNAIRQELSSSPNQGSDLLSPSPAEARVDR